MTFKPIACVHLMSIMPSNGSHLKGRYTLDIFARDISIF